MRYKIAQELGGTPTIDVKKVELQKLIKDSLFSLNDILKKNQEQLDAQIANKLNEVTDNLTEQVEIKLNEIRDLYLQYQHKQTMNDEK